MEKMWQNEPSDAIVPSFTVSDAIAVFNQILDTATPTIVVIGEVGNFKVNQGKWVFFDLKDESGLLSCFMPLYQLRMEIVDGMKVEVLAKPSLTKWGRFSLTIRRIKPVGEGSIKKSFELLRKKLTDEGLFDQSRKRSLPWLPNHIGVISSPDAAGYKDFIKIITARITGLTIDVIHTQVQGEVAADQVIAAIEQFNQLATPPQLIAILRGGGSRDDLVTFDDEKLVRVIAASRIPVITGIGHEIDTTLADLAADVRASTPSNAAELIVPDRRELLADVGTTLEQMVQLLIIQNDRRKTQLKMMVGRLEQIVDSQIDSFKQRLCALDRSLAAYDPGAVLKRGYALIRDSQGRVVQMATVGDRLEVETAKELILTEVIDVTEK